jgi:hypothetical protein
MTEVRTHTKNMGCAVCSVKQLGIGMVATELFVFFGLSYFFYDQHIWFRTRQSSVHSEVHAECVSYVLVVKMY